MPLNPDLLAILACPVCKGGLEAAGHPPAGLVCRKCAVVYPVVEEIPVMLTEEAVPLRQWDRDCPEPDARPTGPQTTA